MAEVKSKDVQVQSEPTLDEELGFAVRRLDPGQRDLYERILMQRRRQLVGEKGGQQNVGMKERWGLLQGIMSGEIPPAGGKGSPLPSVDWEKVRRDFEARGPTFIENSLPRGDRD